MSPYGKDSEEALEQATIALFKSMGWEHIHAYDERDDDPTLLGRDHQGEVVLKRYLEPALKKLNPDFPEDALDQAMEQLTSDRSAMSIAHANRVVYSLLKNGVLVSVREEQGEDLAQRVKVIDWDNIGNNHFLLVSQFWVNGDPYRRRADLVGFVNGLPVIFIELKAPDQSVENAFKDNLRDYKNTITPIFWYNAFVMLSNGTDSKIGSITAPWEHFADWKKINDEGEKGTISLDTLIRGTCEKSRFMDILENFIVFSEEKGGLIKLLAKNHQYLGVNNVIRNVRMLRENQGRLGVFWHTQGSGKSASMVFFTQKVLRKIPGNWTFVIVTDRQELDGQIYKTFKGTGIITEEHTQATSSKHLRELLTEDHRYVFTLIHKFRTDEGKKHPVLSERNDIIVITDEAHRSQYDVLAQNMREALPKASFIGFTGTPLIDKEQERTREVFGDYVSVYNFRQSIEDNATVPLYYENRLPGVQLSNEDLDSDMEKLLDDAMLDYAQEKKIERQFSRQYQILTRDSRLEEVAEDIVSHFMGRGNRGKAMVIAIDKATAVRMYDKVTDHWTKYLNRLKQEVHTDPEAIAIQREKIAFMLETDMAVVVSQSQNEVEDLRKKDADITSHRMRMVKEDLETKFKDPDDPFRIVFVCSMWMTGFDVPSCSTIYIDKLMRNHTLMQAIARANRVFGEKQNGLIVDYVGIFRNLEHALSIYAKPGEGGEIDTPIEDKIKLKALLRQAVEVTEKYLLTLGVELDTITKTEDVFERTKLKEDAVNGILVNDQTKKEFLRLANQVRKIHKAYLPDPLEADLVEALYIIRKLATRIHSLVPRPDISDVMEQLERLLDESIEGYVIERPPGGAKVFNLAEIDFEKIQERFEKGRKKRVMVEILKGVLEQKLKQMIEVNPSRMDFQKTFQDMIKEYNEGAHNIEEIFNMLVELTKELNDEEKRYLREELGSEQELAIFDILTRPVMDLTDKEMKRVKKIASELLETLRKEKLVLDWRKKQQTRAGVQVTIKEYLDELPSRYSDDLYREKCGLVYHHIYDSFNDFSSGIFL